MVTNTNYCKKNFCYIIDRPEPYMVNTDDKFDPNYSEEDIPIVGASAVPFTGDIVVYYFVALFSSILLVSIVLVVKRNKNKQLIRA